MRRVCLKPGGRKRREAYFDSLIANDVQVMAGNKRVAEAVGAGKLAFGLTDTDDALVEVRAGSPILFVYPDQEPGGLGTLFIPNTVAVIKGAAHREAAERLADYLLSPAVEKALAVGASGQIPLNPAVEVKTQVETPRTVKAMEVDFEAAALRWEEAGAYLLERFGGN